MIVFVSEAVSASLVLLFPTVSGDDIMSELISISYSAPLLLNLENCDGYAF